MMTPSPFSADYSLYGLNIDKTLELARLRQFAICFAPRNARKCDYALVGVIARPAMAAGSLPVKIRRLQIAA